MIELRRLTRSTITSAGRLTGVWRERTFESTSRSNCPLGLGRYHRVLRITKHAELRYVQTFKLHLFGDTH